MSQMYSGTQPFNDLKVKSSIFNWHRLLIGSQCSSFRIGVIDVHRLVWLITRAALFCTSWSRCRLFMGSPIQTLLQLSRRAIPIDCTKVLTAVSERYLLMLFIFLMCMLTDKCWLYVSGGSFYYQMWPQVF